MQQITNKNGSPLKKVHKIKAYTKKDFENSKNWKLLSEFWKYCIDHPELRFWQALRNWAEQDYIMAVKERSHTYIDTFYWTSKNK